MALSPTTQHAVARCVALAMLSAGVATTAYAESTITTGTGSLTTSARLDFRITVPKFLYLRIGTGNAMAANGTVDLIDFVVPSSNVGDGSPVSATAGSGDLGSGAVTARLMGNVGDITLQSATLGSLQNGTGETISFSEIETTVASLVSSTPLPHPSLADAATTSTSVAAVNKVVNRDARWTYRYLNSNVVGAGTYGGANVQNGRVTYTVASM